MSSDPSRRIGVIDVGSNTIKLLVAELGSGDDPLKLLHFQAENTRMSVDRSLVPPRIDPGSIAAAAESIRLLTSVARSWLCDDVRAVATSAARDAVNQIEFVDVVQRVTGISLQVLSGEDEARLIGIGTRCDPELRDLSDFTLIDLGGGSLERIAFRGREPVSAESLPLGSVRLTARWVDSPNDPLADSEIQAIGSAARELLAERSALSRNDNVVLTGGAATVVASTHPAVAEFSPQQLEALRDAVCRAAGPEREFALRIPASRSDIMPAALITLCEAVRSSQALRIRFSIYNLRCGVAYAALQGDF